jgi:hypothetical protein
MWRAGGGKRGASSRGRGLHSSPGRASRGFFPLQQVNGALMGEGNTWRASSFGDAMTSRTTRPVAGVEAASVRCCVKLLRKQKRR